MLLWIILLAGIVCVAYMGWQAKVKADKRLADAREEAQRWYERLGGQTMNLVADSDNPAAQQALVDAGERYNAAGSQLERATTARQYELAGDTALEGLHYVRAGREAMGLDPGPQIPDLSGQSRAGSLKEPLEVDVEGKHYTASPQPSQQNSHYYPGGMVAGRPVPGGWYSEPWWKTALVAGAWGLGTMMIFNALIMPAFAGGAIEGAYADGYADGQADSGDAGDPGADGGNVGGGDDFAGGDFGGDFGGGFDF
ncbi:hypothetical protein FB566_1601 [Stackebrandtia endophytica]|uniref:DUF1542 domain-containing protein n=1 Tax=Stackebrandtia endophytica TaxID=1496996 RepID=A0A543AU14_9ACTN|nr:hypothetical protein [Stackebrandtia endophytica]TQL76081.1 hypothetical protein FB566_1601 [Stackebrandtia endophytica]